MLALIFQVSKLAGGIAGGPAGAAAGALLGGAAADGINTGIESAVHHQFTPQGIIAEGVAMKNHEDGAVGHFLMDVGATAIAGAIGGAGLGGAAGKSPFYCWIPCQHLIHVCPEKFHHT